jgi:hypothetical protein
VAFIRGRFFGSEVAIGQFQILNQNSANATNEPLKANASTLSRADMIVFQ